MTGSRCSWLSVAACAGLFISGQHTMAASLGSGIEVDVFDASAQVCVVSDDASRPALEARIRLGLR